MPHINAAGLAIVERFEGLRLRAYPDPGTGGEPWTIGYGHTANVHPGQAISQAQALAFLKSDVAWAEKGVSDCVEVTLTPNQFSALVSFYFNTGTLGTTLLACLNSGDFAGAADQFQHWVYADGDVMPGLVTRRAAERALFLQEG